MLFQTVADKITTYICFAKSFAKQLNTIVVLIASLKTISPGLFNGFWEMNTTMEMFTHGLLIRQSTPSTIRNLTKASHKTMENIILSRTLRPADIQGQKTDI